MMVGWAALVDCALRTQSYAKTSHVVECQVLPRDSGLMVPSSPSAMMMRIIIIFMGVVVPAAAAGAGICSGRCIAYYYNNTRRHGAGAEAAEMTAEWSVGIIASW